MDTNFWKDAYKDLWLSSSKKESEIADFITKNTGLVVIPVGLGAESSDFISGSASQNGYEKGDPDLKIENTNIYLEVTGPLSDKVKSSEPLWFRPDKIDNAKSKFGSHDTFLLHNCSGENLWRVIHIDESFIAKYDAGHFKTVSPYIRGNKEKYVEISADDECVKPLSVLMEYLKKFISTEVNSTEPADTEVNSTELADTEVNSTEPADIEVNDKEDNTINICPYCGEDLVKRIARKGYREGKEFWGCSSYPKCGYIENID